MARRYKLFLIFCLGVVALDQLTKLWARGALANLHHGMRVAGDWFVLRLACNTGAAFGIFAKIGGARVVLSVVALIAVVAVLLYLRRASDRQVWFASALGLVAGGALGNVVDRIFVGCVTDFVVWRYKANEWPAFNVADAALVVGVAILFLDAGREQKRQAAIEGAAKGKGKDEGKDGDTGDAGKAKPTK